MQNKVFFEIFLFFVEIKSATYKTNDVKSSNPTYFLRGVRLPLTDNNDFLLLPNNNNITEINKTLTTSSIIQSRNQHINKTNSKQYEIMNMLWRRTKIFIEVEGYTESYRAKKKDDQRIATVNLIQNRNPFQFPSRTHFSTPSYIEFYYIHEVDDCVQNSSSLNTNIYNDNNVPKINRHHTEEPTVIQNKNNSEHYDPSKKHKLSVPNNFPLDIVPLGVKNTLSIKNTFDKKTNIYTRDFLDPNNCTNLDDLKLSKEEFNIRSTTFYDKIKFFEMYDNQTQIPIVKEDMQNIKNSSNSTSQAKYILLEHIRNDIGHVDKNRRNCVKKHIVEKKNILNVQVKEKLTGNLNSTQATVLFDFLFENKEYSDKMTEPFQSKHESNSFKTFLTYVNKSTLWTEYPFIAVYIYKPLQVHCDAAGISPHWLIASASCLSRHHGILVGGGQSAFVTYCGNSWWFPERVAYVKYTVIHPKYHPHDRIRRQLYNIGAIQIVSSMASACPSWSPVPLMSHQFTANSAGSKATAVGWGLDRYDARYTSTRLPKRPLVSYESLVHSESCPGNFEYSKGRHLNGDVGTKNLYCLSLPPYNGEENDAVHGGLLLAEEKLIALYLQEERRPWGEQSAQYTGTWRLIPWIFDVAQEFEETDTFTIDV